MLKHQHIIELDIEQLTRETMVEILNLSEDFICAIAPPFELEVDYFQFTTGIAKGIQQWQLGKAEEKPNPLLPETLQIPGVKGHRFIFTVVGGNRIVFKPLGSPDTLPPGVH